MFKYIVKRLGISIIILLGVSIIIYTMVRLMPIDFITTNFAGQIQTGAFDENDLLRFKELYGLADNSFLGILKGYFKWLANVLQGDFGNSFKYRKPVTQVIGENMWISFAIAMIATVLQFLIAIPLGISSATHQYSVRDYTVTVFTMIGLSLPTYFFAAIVVKIFAVNLGWLPANGLIYASSSYPATFLGFMSKLGDMALHLILPIGVSVVLSLGGLMRYTRTNTLEVLSADYIRTARAKGLSEKKVIYKHAFRNTLIPLATLLAGIIPSLFGGMMITEQVFAIDGIGRLAYQALTVGDVPFVMGYNMFLAVLTVLGTLLSDIMYSIVDPRVKLGR
ncbi:MAG: ABC transporter permease [Clostridia bacterium]|nr:ABC transporter permease [Clostridia bacterium]